MYYGLIIISAAWIWQWYRFNRGHRSFDPWFLRLQALGFLIVTLDTFQIANWLSWTNALSLLVIFVLLWKLRR